MRWLREVAIGLTILPGVIDLQVNSLAGTELQALRIGSDGHLAFDEPGSSL